MNATEKATIQAEIDALTSQEFAVETNEGTYGAAEAARATGTGDPRWNNYTIYEKISGARRVEGCDPAKAPGRARKLSRADLRAANKRFAELRKQITS